MGFIPTLIQGVSFYFSYRTVMVSLHLYLKSLEILFFKKFHKNVKCWIKTSLRNIIFHLSFTSYTLAVLVLTSRHYGNNNSYVELYFRYYGCWIEKRYETQNRNILWRLSGTRKRRLEKRDFSLATSVR